MPRLLLLLLLNGLFLMGADWLMSGVSVDSYKVALIAAAVLGLVNFFLWPLLTLIALPLTVVTMGLFQLVINGALVLLASEWVDGFWVKNIWWGLGLSILLSLLNGFFGLNKQHASRKA